jgi:hypothetical protein
MKIEIRKTKLDGVIQITTLDERWYAKEIEDIRDEQGEILKKPRKVTIFNPSITWIDKYSPMGVGLLKHYAKHGWDEAELLKNEAAERGSKVHQACDLLLNGGKVSFDTSFSDPDKEKVEPLTPQEYWTVMTFVDWFTELCSKHTVEVVDVEKTVGVDAAPGEPYGYAGTRDIKLRVDGEPWAIDLKTSKAIYLGHELQLSALKHADPENPKTFILQIGYNLNQRGWKLTETEDKFPLFQAAMKFWRDANPDSKPKQKDYPPELKLLLPVPKIEVPPSVKPKPKSRKPAKGTRSKSKK